MSNETDKPLAGALKAAREVASIDHRAKDHESQECGTCLRYAEFIARESGLAELVEAVERASLDEENTPLGRVTIDANDWRLIVAAARRVKEG